MVMSTAAARALGDSVGSVHHLGFYTNDQANSPGFPTTSVPAYFTIDVTLVGIVVLKGLDKTTSAPPSRASSAWKGVAGHRH